MGGFKSKNRNWSSSSREDVINLVSISNEEQPFYKRQRILSKSSGEGDLNDVTTQTKRDASSVYNGIAKDEKADKNGVVFELSTLPTQSCTRLPSDVHLGSTTAGDDKEVVNNQEDGCGDDSSHEAKSLPCGQEGPTEYAPREWMMEDSPQKQPTEYLLLSPLTSELLAEGPLRESLPLGLGLSFGEILAETAAEGACTKKAALSDGSAYSWLELPPEVMAIMDPVEGGAFDDVKIGHAIATKEAAILEKLRQANGCQFNIVCYHYGFICRTQYCLVFGALQQTLFSFMELRQHQPLSLSEIRPILKQIFIALIKLQELHIIHTDLKPKNIMFVDAIDYPYRIKLIDFGNAILLNEAVKHKTFQTLYYRAPEIILGAPFGHAIDIWSVGCIAAELYFGWILYKGRTPYEQIRLICETQGLPQIQILNSGAYTKHYFYKYNSLFWMLKSPEEYDRHTRKDSRDRCSYRIKSLNDLFCIGLVTDPYCSSSVLDDKYEFVNLLKRMLAVDHTSRIGPKESVEHSFISMVGLVRYYHNCNYARKSFGIMTNL